MSAKDFMEHVRKLPCSFCWAPGPSDPHHYGPGIMGSKCTDYRTVPLCRRCHDQFHSKRSIAPFDVERTKVELLKTQVDLLTLWLLSEDP